jgi:hypothetical protein
VQENRWTERENI